MASPPQSLPPNVTRAVRTLGRVLAEIGWEPAPVEGIAGFAVDFGEPHLPVATALAAISPAEQFVLYLMFGFTASAERRDECARLFTRINWVLTVGDFQLDYDDGAIRFRTSLDFADADLTEPFIRNAVSGAMAAVEAYANAVADVVARGKSATEALVAVEIDEP